MWPRAPTADGSAAETQERRGTEGKKRVFQWLPWRCCPARGRRRRGCACLLWVGPFLAPLSVGLLVSGRVVVHGNPAAARQLALRGPLVGACVAADWWALLPSWRALWLTCSGCPCFLGVAASAVRERRCGGGACVRGGWLGLWLCCLSARVLVLGCVVGSCKNQSLSEWASRNVLVFTRFGRGRRLCASALSC